MNALAQMSLVPDASRSAILSPCGRYRYTLERVWHEGLSSVVFIMLNPSTADHEVDDPTIRRCVDFAKRWGYGGIIVVNLFAVRSKDPQALYAADDPVGPDNHTHVKNVLDRAYFQKAAVVCAWGVHGVYMDQDRTMLGWIEAEGLKPMALDLTKAGHPKHPLYLSATRRPMPFEGRR